MTDFQKIIKYLAIGLAVFLIVSIFMGIFGVVSLVDSLITDLSDGMNTMRDYPISGTVTELEINVGAAELIIANGTKFSLSANLKDLKVEQVGSSLSVKETLQFGKNYNGAVIRLTVPEDHVFDKLSIFSGAGKLQVSTISAQTLALNLGAGQAVFENLTAQRDAAISTGAGQLTVKGGSLADLDLDMGVGKVELKSRLTGENEIDQGVGEAELALIGTAEDYTIHVEKDIGNATVEGQRIANDTACGSGRNRVEIDGSIGSIRVSFTEE